MNLTSGFGFNQFGENTDYNTLAQVQFDTTVTLTSDSARVLSWDSINHVVYVTYDTYSQDTILIDSTILTGQFKNRHSYLTIPLMAGYEFQLKKWTLNLRAGVGFSFLLNNKSKYINYSLTNFTEPTPKKIKLNYIISPSLAYQVNKKYSINLTPQAIINNSTLINYNDVKQRYTNFGVNIGVVYSL